VVESQPSKLLVAGPIPVSRSKNRGSWPRCIPAWRKCELGTMYQQAAIPIADPSTFAAVREAVAASFSSARVTGFLESLDRSSLRIRDFELVLHKGLLGSPMASEYAHLPASDQGQIRELYLASLERVAPELRNRFFKLYAYY